MKVDENQNVLVGGLVDHASLHGSPNENYGGALLGNNNSYAFDGSEDYGSNEYPSLSNSQFESFSIIFKKEFTELSFSLSLAV